MSVEDRNWMYSGWKDNGCHSQQLLRGLKYYARIQAILDHSRKVKNVQICDKVARQRSLTKQEYLDQQPIWCATNAWLAMANEWSNPEWIQKSMTNLANRYSGAFKPHKGGSNSIATICQKLSEKEGREVSQIEAWVYTHRGKNPQDPTSLNTEDAAACLERYKTKAIELNGPDFDWLHSPVDASALYQCCCGRPHGKWATFNGMVDDGEVLAVANSHRESSRAFNHQRREEDEREKRRLSEDARLAKEDARLAKEDARLAKEYAQTLLEWGRGVHNQYNSMQSFMQNVAQHTGMPASAVPSPLSLPPPPSCRVSASPNPSQNTPTVGSAIGVENPDDILRRVAHGMFGGYVNTSGEAGGNYSLDLDNQLGPF